LLWSYGVPGPLQVMLVPSPSSHVTEVGVAVAVTESVPAVAVAD